MPKFTVRRIIDAYAIAEAEIEAATAAEAAKLARDDESKYTWEDEHTEHFGARDFVALGEDGGEIEETRIGDL